MLDTIGRKDVSNFVGVVGGLVEDDLRMKALRDAADLTGE